MIKKFIRGNKERGAEVIKALNDLGGVNPYKLCGIDPNSIYFINLDNNITKWTDSTHYAIIIQECFEEIKLEDKIIVTNRDFIEWYFDKLKLGDIVQMRFEENGDIITCPLNYDDDNNPCKIRYVRLNFNEWIKIENVIFD